MANDEMTIEVHLPLQFRLEDFHPLRITELYVPQRFNLSAVGGKKIGDARAQRRP